MQETAQTQQKKKKKTNQPWPWPQTATLNTKPTAGPGPARIFIPPSQKAHLQTKTDNHKQFSGHINTIRCPADNETRDPTDSVGGERHQVLGLKRTQEGGGGGQEGEHKERIRSMERTQESQFCRVLRHVSWNGFQAQEGRQEARQRDEKGDKNGT